MTGAPDLCGYYRAISETPVNIKHDAARLHCHAAESSIFLGFVFEAVKRRILTFLDPTVRNNWKGFNCKKSTAFMAMR